MRTRLTLGLPIQVSLLVLTKVGRLGSECPAFNRAHLCARAAAPLFSDPNSSHPLLYNGIVMLLGQLDYLKLGERVPDTEMPNSLDTTKTLGRISLQIIEVSSRQLLMVQKKVAVTTATERA